MPIEDVTYLLENSEHDSFIVNADSSLRDKNAYPTPSEFSLHFDNHFSYVYGVDVLDVSMPSSMWNVENLNNTMKYHMIWSNLNYNNERLDKKSFYQTYFNEILTNPSLHQMFTKLTNNRMLFIDKSDEEHPDVQNMLDGGSEENMIAIRDTIDNIVLQKITIINDNDVQDFFFIRIQKTLYKIRKFYTTTIKKLKDMISQENLLNKTTKTHYVINTSQDKYKFVFENEAYEIPVVHEYDEEIFVYVLQYGYVYSDENEKGNDSSLNVEKFHNEILFVEKTLLNVQSLLKLKNGIYRYEPMLSKSNDEIVNYIKQKATKIQLLHDYDSINDNPTFRDANDKIKLHSKSNIRVKIRQFQPLIEKRLTTVETGIRYNLNIPFRKVNNETSLLISTKLYQLEENLYVWDENDFNTYIDYEQQIVKDIVKINETKKTRKVVLPVFEGYNSLFNNNQPLNLKNYLFTNDVHVQNFCNNDMFQIYTHSTDTNELNVIAQILMPLAHRNEIYLTKWGRTSRLYEVDDILYSWIGHEYEENEENEHYKLATKSIYSIIDHEKIDISYIYHSQYLFDQNDDTSYSITHKGKKYIIYGETPEYVGIYTFGDHMSRINDMNGNDNDNDNVYFKHPLPLTNALDTEKLIQSNCDTSLLFAHETDLYALEEINDTKSDLTNSILNMTIDSKTKSISISISGNTDIFTYDLKERVATRFSYNETEYVVPLVFKTSIVDLNIDLIINDEDKTETHIDLPLSVIGDTISLTNENAWILKIGNDLFYFDNERETLPSIKNFTYALLYDTHYRNLYDKTNVDLIWDETRKTFQFEYEYDEQNKKAYDVNIVLILWVTDSLAIMPPAPQSKNQNVKYFVEGVLLQTIVSYTYHYVSNVELGNTFSRDKDNNLPLIPWCNFILFNGFFSIEPGNYNLFQFIQELNNRFIQSRQFNGASQIVYEFPFVGNNLVRVMKANDIGDVTKTGQIKFVISDPNTFFILDLKNTKLRDTIGFSVRTSTNNTNSFKNIVHQDYGDMEMVSSITKKSDVIENIIIPPGVVYLLGVRYVTLRCPEIESLIGTHSYGKYSPGIGIFILGMNQQTVKQRLDFVHYVRKPFHPIEKLKRLTFRFELPDGSLYDFKGVDMFMILQIKTYVPKRTKTFDYSTSQLNPNYNPNFIEYTIDEERKRIEHERFTLDKNDEGSEEANEVVHLQNQYEDEDEEEGDEGDEDEEGEEEEGDEEDEEDDGDEE